MKSISIIIIGIFLFQCSPSHNNEIPVYNDITFKLYQSESVEEITPTTVELYDTLFNGANSEIPLFRSIKHQKYNLFIGLPFNTSYEKLRNEKITRHSTSYISKTVTDSCFFIEYSINNKTIATEHLINSGNNNSLVFIATLRRAESNNRDSIFSFNGFNQRIKSDN